MNYLKVYFTLVCVAILSTVQAQPNPKNIQTAQKYVYFLDNGFEKIDLLKVGSVDRTFFTIGNPRLIIAHKDDKGLRNILNSFTLIVEPSDASVQSKVFNIHSPAFTDGARQMMYILKPQSKITFSEVKLNIADDSNSKNPGGKYVNPVGTLPVAFFLYIK